MFKISCGINLRPFLWPPWFSTTGDLDRWWLVHWAWMVETHFHDRIGSFRLGKGIGLEDCFDQMENTRELPTFTDVS